MMFDEREIRGCLDSGDVAKAEVMVNANANSVERQSGLRGIRAAIYVAVIGGVFTISLEILSGFISDAQDRSARVEERQSLLVQNSILGDVEKTLENFRFLRAAGLIDQAVADQVIQAASDFNPTPPIPLANSAPRGLNYVLILGADKTLAAAQWHVQHYFEGTGAFIVKREGLFRTIRLFSTETEAKNAKENVPDGAKQYGPLVMQMGKFCPSLSYISEADGYSGFSCN